jgi:threonine synthase
MDILISSNLERLIYMIAGCDAKKNGELMKSLKEKGSYEVTPEMKANLSDFAAGYATEAEVKEKIAEVYGNTGYVMDTHTAVAAFVCDKYQKATGDTRKTVVASTASPYKFARSVMTAINERYDALSEFELVDTLEVVSGVDIPKAIEEIQNAEILHTLECDADKMEETVKNILKS